MITAPMKLVSITELEEGIKELTFRLVQSSSDVNFSAMILTDADSDRFDIKWEQGRVYYLKITAATDEHMAAYENLQSTLPTSIEPLVNAKG